MSLSQEIESRIAILDVVNRYVQTKKAGVNFKALCPFHNEKTASFVISPTKNIAKCFSCGKWWGPIRFLMEIENIEFREAASILAREAGIEMKTSFSREQSEKWRDIYLLYKLAAEFYHKEIFLEKNKKFLDYLLNRGLTIETIKKFQLWISNNSRELANFLKSHDFEEKFLIESGLFISPTRDKFFGRIIFPICNTMWNVVAFTGRITETGEPKYLNSPASKIFDKSSILFGLHLAKHTISKSWEIFIVEGQMDTISLHQAWVDNAVGISGTALTTDHIRILKRFTKIVYLALDADSAGIKATFSSIENLLNSDLEIKIIIIPNWKDPDEFLKSGWDFEELKKNSLSAIDYYIQMGKIYYNLDTIVGQKQLIEKCLELISKLISPIEIDFYIKNLAQNFDISRDALYEAFYQKKKQLHKENNWEKISENNNFSPDNLDILAGYLNKFTLFDLFFEKFAYNIDDLQKLSNSRLLSKVLSKSELDNEDSEYLDTIELFIEEKIPEKHPEIIQKNFLDLIRQLHIALLSIEKKQILEKISPNSPDYLIAYTELVKKAQKLSIPQGSIINL